jgi:microcystin-dependent protein
VVTDTVDGIGTTDQAVLNVYSGNPTTATPVPPSIPATAQEIARWTVASTDNSVRTTTLNIGARSFVINTIAPGSVQMFAGDVAPLGWLFCRGAPVSRQTYARLFTVIGTRFGAGDTTTTFNLPNFQATYPVGYNTDSNSPSGLPGLWNNGVGERGGYKDLILPAHNHRINDHRHNTKIDFARFATGPQSQGHTHNVSGEGKGWIRRGDEWYVRVVPKSDDGAKLGIEDNPIGGDVTSGQSQGHTHNYDLPERNPVSTWHGGQASARDDLYTYTQGTEAAGGGWISYVNRNLPPGLSINFIIRT